MGDGFAVVLQRVHIKQCGFFIVDFAEIVAHAFNFQPLPLRVHHFPPRQIVQRGAPQHGFFAARVHGDIAADARSIRRSGVHRKHPTRRVRRFFHAPRNHARAAANNRMLAIQPRQFHQLNAVVFIQFFGVDDSRHCIQRHRPARVARAAAARDNG